MLIVYLVGLFFAFIFVFSVIYYGLYKYSLRPRVVKRRNGVSGLKQKSPAFFTNDLFKERTIIEAIDELRLLKFMGEILFDRWQSFNRDSLHFTSDQLKENHKLDISVTELIEKIFPKYWGVAIYLAGHYFPLISTDISAGEVLAFYGN